VARPLRLLVADGIYHVTARGIARNEIYLDDHDRRVFLHILVRTLERFDWACLSYCLMPNHFHLLIRTPIPNLSRGMARLKSGYAQAHNRRHERIGPLFAGRFSARLVQRDRHLLETFRYIALNPVAAGLCETPSSWRWSAHRALARVQAAPEWLAVDESLGWFGDAGGTDGVAEYSAFVAESSDPPAPPPGVVLGDEDFRRRHLPAGRPGSEFAEHDWGDGRPKLAELLRDGGSGKSIAAAYRTHGYTMRSIASFLERHVCTVSRRLRAYETEMRECKT
jgi:putative transposase